MNWDAVAAVGEILGAIAVVATLGYLAIQVQHARQETRRAINQNRAEAARQLLMTDATDERLMGILTKALVGSGAPPHETSQLLMQRAGLTLEEAFTVYQREAAWWQYRSEIIRNVESLAPGTRVQFDWSVYANYSINPIGQVWYQSSKGGLDPDAVRYIDNLLAKPARFPASPDSSTLSPSTHEGMR